MNRSETGPMLKVGSAGALLACALFSTTASAHQGGKLTVNCPDDDETYDSINGAAAAANEGDQIVVCPGIYRENVTITVDRLRIDALKDGTVKLVPGDSSQPGITIAAWRDSIHGFAISGFVAGIYVAGPYGHADLENNLLMGNYEGISFSNTRANEVKHNRIFGNSDNGVLDMYGIELIAGEYNKYEANDIEYNVNNGIFINTNAPPCTYQRAEITGNTLNNNGGSGVLLQDSNYAEITGNEASYNGVDGIELVQSMHNTIQKNKADWNGESMAVCGPVEGNGNCIGLHMHSGSDDNKITDNKAHQNLVWDAYDNTFPDGDKDDTHDTGNIWKDNHCDTRDPNGICQR